MRKRQLKKLHKRFVTASVYCGREGIINIHGIVKPSGGFMKKYSNWSVNEYCETPTQEEIRDTLKRVFK